MSTCSEQGCEGRGVRVVGFYTTMNFRRVRVWMCALHFIRGHYTDAVVEMPVPASVRAGEAAVRADQFEAEERSRKTPYNRDNRSIRTLPSSGHGEPILNDRVAQWRWNAY